MDIAFFGSVTLFLFILLYLSYLTNRNVLKILTAFGLIILALIQLTSPISLYQLSSITSTQNSTNETVQTYNYVPIYLNPELNLAFALLILFTGLFILFDGATDMLT